MRKENEERTPLSDWAKQEIKSERSDHFFFLGFASFIAGACVIGGILCSIVERPNTNIERGIFLSITIIPSLIWILVFLGCHVFGEEKWREKKDKVFAQNEMDYHRSLKLKPVLDHVHSLVVSDFPVLEKEVEGTWRPFRVEHFLSESMRSEIHGQTKLRLFSLGLSIRGQSRSVATPNLLDTSSVIFLKNDEGKTLRALIPSPRTTKEMIAGAMQRWFSEVSEETHTRAVLEGCSFLEENIATPISHPELIDSLDASCELSFPNRPEVSIVGQEIQKGVVITSALEVGGKTSIFLPTGFFKQLADDISSAVQNVLPAPTAVEAIGTV